MGPSGQVGSEERDKGLIKERDFVTAQRRALEEGAGQGNRILSKTNNKYLNTTVQLIGCL